MTFFLSASPSSSSSRRPIRPFQQIFRRIHSAENSMLFPSFTRLFTILLILVVFSTSAAAGPATTTTTTAATTTAPKKNKTKTATSISPTMSPTGGSSSISISNSLSAFSPSISVSSSMSGSTSQSAGSPSVSFSTSASNSQRLTQTRSARDSRTRTLPVITPPVTDSVSVTASLSMSASVSPSKTDPSVSLSNTSEITKTKSVVATKTGSLSLSQIVTPSQSASVSQSVSASRTLVDTASATKFPPPTKTISDSPEPTVSSTTSRTVLNSDTRTAVASSTMSSSRTLPLTFTATPPLTLTHPATVTPTGSVSHLGTATMTKPGSVTLTLTNSSLPTASHSALASGTLTYTANETLTLSVVPSASRSISHSANITGTEPRTVTLSLSESVSVSPSLSSSLTDSLSRSLQPTATASITSTMSESQSQSRSRNTLSLSGSPSVTMTTSQSTSASVSLSGTLSQSGTLSLSATFSQSLSISVSQSLSNSGTATVTLSISASQTQSCTQSLSATFGSATMTLSLPLTTSVIPPTTTAPRTPTLTLPTSCPDDCMNGVCTRDPRWAFVYYCVCYQTAARGYWSGGEQGGPCDKCSTGYYGARCVDVCPGGTCAICSGHGTCNDGRAGDGTCNCYEDSRGHWAGASCILCASGYYGSDCTKACTCTQYGVCSDGRTGNGGCTCITDGWSGDNCEVCDATKVLTGCDLSCPSDENDVECYGHGTCQASGFSSKCLCDPMYGGEGCNKLCPGTTAMIPVSEQCSGHGLCRDGSDRDGGCTCDTNYAQPDCSSCERGYYGPTCTFICPGGVAKPCNNSGTCLGTGVCSCTGIYGGANCNITCPLKNGSVCSGHGSCVGSDAHCECFADDINGYWMGAFCDVCADTHGGSGCTKRCPVVKSGAVCNGVTFGICNKTDGACSCKSGYCGTYCDSTPAQQCSSCPSILSYGDDCEYTCDCQNGATCDAGRSGTGACTCTRGWYGSSCNLPCDGGVSNPCSNRGVCDQSTGQCTCDDGYAGTICELACPGGLTCSGHGTCDSGRLGSGNCTCAANYVWPSTGCDTFCNCSGHGKCIYPSNQCVCDPNYNGTNCERCISGYWNSSTCTSPCVNGTTSGYDCQCNAGWGGMSCDSQCPANANGPCNGQGTCSKTTGLCTCFTGWVGAMCSCNTTTCQQTNIYTVCDAATATCVCATRRTGSTCAECMFGFYGTTCTTQCDCNNNGPCDIDSGICSCYTDDTNGYWTGGTCSICLDGYMGTGCKQRSNAISTLSTLKATATIDVSQLYAFLDEEDGIIYVGGNPYNAAFNVSTVLPTFMSGSTLYNDTNSTRICGDIGGASYITVNGKKRQLFIVQPNLTCSGYVKSYTSSVEGNFGNLSLYSPNAFFNSFSTSYVDNTMAFFFHERSTNTICTIVDSTNQELFCYKLQTGNALQETFSVVQLPTRAIKAAILSKTYPGRFYLGGTDRQNLCAIQVAYTTEQPPVVQPISIAAYRLRFNNATCTTVDGLTEAGNLLIFSIVQDSMYIAAYDTATGQWYTPVYVGASSQRTNGITYDPVSKIGFAVFRTRVMKFTVDQANKAIVAYGQVYITTQHISSLIPHPAIQVVYAPLSTAKGIEILRFMMLEVLSIEPTVAERIGGTVVTVTGRGFRNVTTLQCKIGDVVVKAKFIDNNTVTCVAPVVLTTKACVADAVEITTTNIVYTQNAIALDRPDSPTLESASPTFVRVGVPQLVTLTGRGFTSTVYAKCRFSDTGTPPVYTNATFNATAGTYSCMSPNAAAPWSPSALAYLSLDGQVYGTHSVPFLIIGSAAGISVTPNSLTAVSAPSTTLSPAVTVYVVDEKGNELRAVDSFSRPVSIFSSLPANGSTGVTADGVSVMDNYTLNYPTTGYWAATAMVGNWSAAFYITVKYGSMVTLRVKTQPLLSGDIVVPGSAIPRQTEVEGIDAAGNVVNDNTGISVNAYMVMLNETDGSLLLTDNETKSFGAISFLNTGVALLPQVVVTPMFGQQYTLFFAVASRSDINTTSMNFYPQCATTMFFVKGMRECISCPTSQATCNGSEVINAKPGYWRASDESLQFYECPKKEVCLGGAAGCAEGYSGAMCTVCAEGYGLGYRGSCDECDSLGVDIVVIMLLLIALLLILIVGALLFVQNYSVPESLMGRTITTGLIMLFYLQSVTLLGLLDLDATEMFKSALGLIAVVADFRFYGLHTTACILSRSNLNLQHISLLYSTGFIMVTILVTVAVGGILRYKPYILMCKEAVAAREARLSMTEAILKLRYRGRHVDGLAEMLKPKEHKKSALLMTSMQVCVLFLLQPVAITTFQLFDCVEVVSSTGTNQYLRNDMRVACDSSAYEHYYGFAVFIVIVIALLLPMAVVFGIALARRHMGMESFRLWSGTMTYGLKDSAFFYQGMVITRRIFCVCAIVFSNYPIDAYAVVWVLTAFVGIQSFIQPYVLPEHNRYECLATSSVIISGNLAFLFQVASNDQERDIITAILLLLLSVTIGYLAFVLLWTPVTIFYAEYQKSRIEFSDFATGQSIISHTNGRDEDEDDDVELEGRRRSPSERSPRRPLPTSPLRGSPKGSPMFSNGSTFDHFSSRYTGTQAQLRVPSDRQSFGSEDYEGYRRGEDAASTQSFSKGGDGPESWYQRKQLERKASLASLKEIAAQRRHSEIKLSPEDVRTMAKLNSTGGDADLYHDQQQVYLVTKGITDTPPVPLAEEMMEMASMASPTEHTSSSIATATPSASSAALRSMPSQELTGMISPEASAAQFAPSSPSGKVPKIQLSATLQMKEYFALRQQQQLARDHKVDQQDLEIDDVL